MKILVTGGTGRVGSEVVKELQNALSNLVLACRLGLAGQVELGR